MLLFTCKLNLVQYSHKFGSRGVIVVLYFLYNACSVYLPRLIWIVGIVVKLWWQDETEPNTTLAADLAAKHGRLIVLDINGVLLTSYRELS